MHSWIFFFTYKCPICLEPFDLTPDKESDNETTPLQKEKSPPEKQKQKMRRVDSFGIPLYGSDDQPIKILRCGHIFDMTCWQMWVDSGTGNPYICPVCRQDVGRAKRRGLSSQGSSSSGELLVDGSGDTRRVGNGQGQNNEQSSLFARMMATASGPSMLLRPVTQSPHHPNYNSVQSSRAQQGRSSSPFAPLTHPTFRRLHPMFGLPAAPPMPPGEQTPLFARASTSNEDDDDY